MNEHWEHHFKYYDFFQNNSSRYRAIIDLHAEQLHESKKILDTGAGSGNLTLKLLEEGHELVAVDSNEIALNLLREKCRTYGEKLRVVNMDVQSLDLGDDEFDGVSSMFVIPFVEDNRKYFSEAYRVLREGGKFSISAWAPLKDSWHGIMEILEAELKSKGIIPKYQREWEHLSESSRTNLRKYVVKGPELSDLKMMLGEVGFKEVQYVQENPFGKYVNFLSCTK
jgi:ubiquinone/menaquinone biosynthesis C-methylase UbiE